MNPGPPLFMHLHIAIQAWRRTANKARRRCHPFIQLSYLSLHLNVEIFYKYSSIRVHNTAYDRVVHSFQFMKENYPHTYLNDFSSVNFWQAQIRKSHPFLCQIVFCYPFIPKSHDKLVLLEKILIKYTSDLTS